MGVLECKEELIGQGGGPGDADNSGLAPTGLKGPSCHAVEVTALQAGLTPGLLRVCPRGTGPAPPAADLASATLTFCQLVTQPCNLGWGHPGNVESRLGVGQTDLGLQRRL